LFQIVSGYWSDQILAWINKSWQSQLAKI